MARITPESIRIETLGSSILPTFLGGSYGEPLVWGPSGRITLEASLSRVYFPPPGVNPGQVLGPWLGAMGLGANPKALLTVDPWHGSAAAVPPGAPPPLTGPPGCDEDPRNGALDPGKLRTSGCQWQWQR